MMVRPCREIYRRNRFREPTRSADTAAIAVLEKEVRFDCISEAAARWEAIAADSITAIQQSKESRRIILKITSRLELAPAP